MRLLLDTHILIWAATLPEYLTPTTRDLILQPDNQILFSIVSLWEIAIKYGLGRKDFSHEPQAFRQALIEAGFQELGITAEHVMAVASLPQLHRDPFDRLLIAQAELEHAILITSDGQLSQYGRSVYRV